MSGAGAANAWIVDAASRRGDAEALVSPARTLSWRQLADLAMRAAAGLAALGVRRGDLVAVRAAPGPDLVALFHALQALGAAMLPLNLRWTAAESMAALGQASPRLLVDDHDEALAAPCPRVHPRELATHEAPRRFALPTTIDVEATLAVVFTSGTTTRPKGVVLTNANFAAGARASAARLGHGAGDTWLATLPLFHVGGLAILARAALDASRVVLAPGFDAAATAAVLSSGEATMVSVVPTMLVRVLENMAGAPSPRVRAVLVGGAALSPALGRRALDAGLPVAATYGLTEACSQVATTAPGHDDAARGLVGLPLAGTEVRILEPDRDGWGRIAVRGPQVMGGYLGDEAATRGALADGWLVTGDLGRLDERGALAVAGRRDDLVVTGGENVAPLEVEQVLDAHPTVAESVVVGVEDEAWGQRVAAAVVPRPGAEPTAAELDAWCRGRLAAYKVPKEIRVVDALLRGPTGKVLRRLP